MVVVVEHNKPYSNNGNKTRIHQVSKRANSKTTGGHLDSIHLNNNNNNKNMTNCQQQQDDDDDDDETSSVTETAHDDQSSLNDSTANLGQHGGLFSMSTTTATPATHSFSNAAGTSTTSISSRKKRTLAVGTTTTTIQNNRITPSSHRSDQPKPFTKAAQTSSATASTPHKPPEPYKPPEPAIPAKKTHTTQPSPSPLVSETETTEDPPRRRMVLRRLVKRRSAPAGLVLLDEDADDCDSVQDDDELDRRQIQTERQDDPSDIRRQDLGERNDHNFTPTTTTREDRKTRNCSPRRRNHSNNSRRTKKTSSNQNAQRPRKPLPGRQGARHQSENDTKRGEGTTSDQLKSLGNRLMKKNSKKNNNKTSDSSSNNHIDPLKRSKRKVIKIKQQQPQQQPRKQKSSEKGTPLERVRAMIALQETRQGHMSQGIAVHLDRALARYKSHNHVGACLALKHMKRLEMEQVHLIKAIGYLKLLEQQLLLSPTNATPSTRAHRSMSMTHSPMSTKTTTTTATAAGAAATSPATFPAHPRTQPARNYKTLAVAPRHDMDSNDEDILDSQHEDCSINMDDEDDNVDSQDQDLSSSSLDPLILRAACAIPFSLLSNSCSSNNCSYSNNNNDSIASMNLLCPSVDTLFAAPSLPRRSPVASPHKTMAAIPPTYTPRGRSANKRSTSPRTRRCRSPVVSLLVGKRNHPEKEQQQKQQQRANHAPEKLVDDVDELSNGNKTNDAQDPQELEVEEDELDVQMKMILHTQMDTDHDQTDEELLEQLAALSCISNEQEQTEEETKSSGNRNRNRSRNQRWMI